MGTATMTPSVPLKDAGEAALPAAIGRDAPRERTDRQAPAAHRKRSLDERAIATELPSNSPPKADCKPSKGSDGHAGVIGVEGKVKRDATYLWKGEECGGEVCERLRSEGRGGGALVEQRLWESGRCTADKQQCAQGDGQETAAHRAKLLRRRTSGASF